MLGGRAITRRRAAGSRTAAGVVDTAATTDTAIRGSVQPEGSQDTQRERRRVYTTSELRVADAVGNVRADQLLIDGRVWDVLQVRHTDSVLPHYKALVEREGEAVVTVTTPTAAPTVDYAASSVVANVAEDTVTTAYARGVTLAEVQAGAGTYQQGDLLVELKCDELSVAPSIDSALTFDGVAYEVASVTRDEKRLVWVLLGRRNP